MHYIPSLKRTNYLRILYNDAASISYNWYALRLFLNFGSNKLFYNFMMDLCSSNANIVRCYGRLGILGLSITPHRHRYYIKEKVCLIDLARRVYRKA